MSLLLDYVLALTHLYGLVHKDKVLEVYNQQNDEKVDEAAVNKILESGVNEGFVGNYGDYFVHETILEYRDFHEELSKRQGKPFYIPVQDELLRYKSDYYYEVTDEFTTLKKYTTQHFFEGDEYRAEAFADHIQNICQFSFSMENILNIFAKYKVYCKNEQQFSEVIEHITKLANNVRLWENNGYTPNELSLLQQKG